MRFVGSGTNHVTVKTTQNNSKPPRADFKRESKESLLFWSEQRKLSAFWHCLFQLGLLPALQTPQAHFHGLEGAVRDPPPRPRETDC